MSHCAGCDGDHLVDRACDFCEDLLDLGEVCSCDATMVIVMKGLIERLVDQDPCDYDHHDLCQAHNLHERPCPHEEGKILLERIEDGRK